MKQRLQTGDDIQWLFLSGGYGVIHALEVAVEYQATFSRKEAQKNDIPYTGDIWCKAGLSCMCDDIVEKFDPSCVYIFGNEAYTAFIKDTRF